jgi:hypothetical protein
MLPVSPDCAFLIATSVFSIVYLNKKEKDHSVRNNSKIPHCQEQFQNEIEKS